MLDNRTTITPPLTSNACSQDGGLISNDNYIDSWWGGECDIREPQPRERTIVDEVEGVLKEAIGYVCGWKTLENEGKALNKAANPTKQLEEAKKRLSVIIKHEETQQPQQQCCNTNYTTHKEDNDCVTNSDTCGNMKRESSTNNLITGVGNC